jgi:hypothetical protein
MPPSPRGRRGKIGERGLGERVWLVKSKTEQLDPKEKKGKKGHMGFIY